MTCLRPSFVFLAPLVGSVMAFSGCFQTCEITRDCWALSGVYASVDLRTWASAEEAAHAFESLGYQVSPSDAYVEASNITEKEFINVRLHGLPSWHEPVDRPASLARLCIEYGDWSHHNSERDALARGADHAAKVRLQAQDFVQRFTGALGASTVGELAWETHAYAQADGLGPGEDRACL